MTDGKIRPLFTVVNGLRAGVYLLASYLLLYPVLTTPLIADDLLNPFAQSVDGGNGLGAALRYGWRGSIDGGSFRLAGTITGAAYNWLWMATSAKLGINMTTLYAITKYVVFIVCAATVAAFWYVASRAFGRRVRPWDALVLVSVALFGTLQLHLEWSNDPVASYPLAGFLPTALGFGVLAATVVAVKRPTWRVFVCGGLFAALAVAYYEISVGAVLGAGVIFAHSLWSVRRDRSALLRSVAGAAVFLGLPMVVAIGGRLVVGGNNSNYGGTDVALSRAPKTFARGALGSVPGTAWRLSERILHGRIPIVFASIALVLVLAVLLRWWAVTSAREERERPPVRDRGACVACALAVVIYASFAVGLQALTDKVQDETLEVGYIYTFYAMASTAIALGIAVGLKALLASPRMPTLRFAALAVGASFLLVQSMINFRLSEQANADYQFNNRLLNAFDEDSTPAERCKALDLWYLLPFPEYYETGMTNGLRSAYEYYFGEPFCDQPAPTG